LKHSVLSDNWLDNLFTIYLLFDGYIAIFSSVTLKTANAADDQWSNGYWTVNLLQYHHAGSMLFFKCKHVKSTIVKVVYDSYGL